MTDIEFQAWPKTPRLFRDITITEKIDGTNAAIIITEDGQVAAQSRRRLITPESDNYGFARWVYDNRDELADILGPGRHFGEWWGKGIQRGYDMPAKVFSLFNAERWFKTGEDGLDSMSTRAATSSLAGLIRAVPVLYRGPFSEDEITDWLKALKRHGSMANRGFMNPEGICIYHSQTRSVFKVTLDNQDRGKWEVSA